MLKKNLIAKIEKAKDDEDINELLKGTDIETAFKGEEPTLDTFKEKIKSDKDFKSFMDTERDTYHAKALKTMKEKGTWENEFQNEINTKYPDLIKDPTQKKLAELEAELAKEKAANARKDLLSQATKYAAEKKLPTGFVEKFLGEDLDSTKANLDSFAESWSKEITAAVDTKLKGSRYIPGQGGDGGKISIGEAMAKENSKANTVSAPNLWGSKAEK